MLSDPDRLRVEGARQWRQDHRDRSAVEDPAADARLWKKLSTRIAALERGDAGAPLSWFLASVGPRFAAAAALALILTVGLAWTQEPFSPGASSAAVQLATLVESPEDALGAALRAGGGDDLFQYIAYTSGR